MACEDMFRINKHLLPVKASYYFTLAAVASLLPYMAVYMKQLGLSPSETAIIYGTMPFLGALVRPVFGAAADKTHKHKEILMVVSILTGAFHALLLVVPGVPKTTPFQTAVQLSCGAESNLKYCGIQKLGSEQCQLTAEDLFNGTQLRDKFDPFVSASNCSLRCHVQEKENLCLKNKEGAEICDEFHSSPEENATKLEIYFNFLNRVRSALRSDNGSKPAICNFYALTNITHRGSEFTDLHCKEPVEIECRLICGSVVNSDLSQKCVEVPFSPTRYATTFWGFFVLMFLANVAFAPVFSLIDAMTYDFLGEERGKWGRQRLWGTIGFALHGLATGFLMDQLSNSGREFLLAFISFAFFEIVTAVVVCQYRISSNVACHSMMSNLRALLTRLDIVALFAIIFVFGMFTGVIETFLFWYLTGLGATKTLFGLCMFLNCLPEILIFFLSGLIMKHIGQVRCLYIVFIAYALRFFGYTQLRNPWFVLIIEPLHSITYGLMYAAATSYGSIITPPGMHGTVQGLIGGLHFGFGKGCGSVLGGLLYEAVGAIVMFRGCAVTSLVVCIIYFSIQQYLGCKDKSREDSQDSKEKELKDMGTPEEKGEMLPTSENAKDKNSHLQENGLKEKLNSADC